jgi:hypothetical protein
MAKGNIQNISECLHIQELGQGVGDKLFTFEGVTLFPRF